jgi:hypothetical protein
LQSLCLDIELRAGEIPGAEAGGAR